MSLSHGKLCLRYSSVLFKVVVWNEVVPHFLNRTLEYLRHNFPWERLISRQTNNPGHPICKISTHLTIFWGGTWKTRVCENNQTREDIIRRQIRWIPLEMLNRVVDNFNVQVAAVLCVCVNVCVCVCVCVCMCVYVYTLPPVGFFWLHNIFDIHEKFGSTIFCCEYSGSFCQVPSSLFLNLSYFTSKDENSSQPLTGEKGIWYNVCR